MRACSLPVHHSCLNDYDVCKYSDHHVMVMKKANSEDMILERFRDEDSVLIIDDGNKDELVDVLRKIRDPDNWSKWIQSYGKADPTPDFYSDELGMMMEVMSVDDRTYQDGRRFFNKTKEAENKAFQEFKSWDCGDDVSFVPLVSSGLPYYQDHNYSRYVADFQRVVGNHKSKIETYRANHPGCGKLIFFIFDESTPYIFLSEPSRKPSQLLLSKAKPHLFYEDRAFLKVFDDPRIDYVIWYTPYKVYSTISGPKPFVTSVIFSGRKHRVGRRYSVSRMASAEL